MTDTKKYFDSLDQYRNGQPETIVRLAANASFIAIENAIKLVTELHEIREEWQTQITARADSNAWKIADMLFEQPVIDGPYIQAELKITTANSLRAVQRLVDANVLHEVSGSTRNRKWAATEILGALDNFAARAGKRST